MAETMNAPQQILKQQDVGRGGGARVGLYGVSKRYGELPAVDGVTLNIAAGEFITILGPSGSGKSTILNILSGFTQPDTGDVRVDDVPIVHTPPHRRGFGMVFQNYAIFPHMTVYENIAFPLRMRGAAKANIDKSVREALRLVNLTGLESRYAQQLSGGQQQRIAFARAVVFGPKVLLMDEPLSALDRNLRQQLQVELRRLHRQLGITIILVTHDQEEALAMSDRIAIMKNGRIVQVGTGPELYERPVDEFVARFFGESNVLEGKVASVDGADKLLFAGGMVCCTGRKLDRPAGSKVRVVLRPDRVRVAVGGMSPAFTARVEDITYLGEVARLDLQLDGGLSLVARMPSAMLTCGKGDAVQVTWRDEDLKVFTDEATSGL
ncbi:MAG: hypothetical protein RIS90_1218 [Pseudomonadota bacterium]|jgi:putative spermidine/putrescine transport system ATP-binding protein